MSNFKLLRNWNGHFKGDEIFIPSHLDAMVTFNKIGDKIIDPVVEDETEEPKEDLNKMITPEYKKRGRKKTK